MSTLRLLVLILLIRLSHSAPCIALDPPGPFRVSLIDGRALLTLNVSLCGNSSLNVSAVPSRLSPSFSVQPLSTTPDACNILRTTLVFQSLVGSGKLVLSASPCTISVPVVVAGVEAYHLPSRDAVTSVGARPVRIPAPRRNPVRVFFAVRAILPAGDTLRTRKAAKALEVSISPAVPSVNATLGIGDHVGNLQIVSTDPRLQAPRQQLIQTVKLGLPNSDIGATFRIIHAPLVATIRAVEAPARLSPEGGERIVLVLRRAAADQRRLVIGNVTVFETEYTRRGITLFSSFISPPLPSGRYKWRMELIIGSNVTVAKDTTGHVFKVARRPVLTSMLPAVAKPDTDGFVILSGTFEDSVTVFLDGEPTSADDIVYRASGEVIMRLPGVKPTFNKTVSVSVKSVRGTQSNALLLKFDPNAVYVDAVVAHASANLSNGRFEIPFLCNRSEPPVIFARADTPQDVYEPPSFNFSVRTSASGLRFEELSYGPSGMVSLDRDLFGDDSALERDFVTVRIIVSQQERSGETIVLVSRRLQRDVIGVTILSPFEAQRGIGRDVLEAQVTRLGHCRDATNFETQTSWFLNKRTVISADSDDAKRFETGSSAIAVGLGRTVVVPDRGGFSYFATVGVTDRSTGKQIASGTSRRPGRLKALEPSLRTFLNGGLGSITLRSGMEAYEIHSSVYDVDVAISSPRVQYSWACKSLTPKSSSCPDALFPAAVGQNRRVAGFNVTTIGVREETVVEYFLTVRAVGRQLGNAHLRLSVGPASATVFPSSEIFAGPSLPDVLSDGMIQFSCYQLIILAILDARVNYTYSFALFREGNDTNIFETSEDDILISHRGYWSPQDRDSVLLGIQPNKLEAANYTLYGARDGNAEVGRDASWTFRIQRCPTLVPYQPPFVSGAAGLTTFFAGATSVPPSRNLFFFELTRQRDGEPALATDPRDSTAYMLGCSGSELCTFSVPAAGRYFLQVDMFDPSGTRKLSSERLETPLTVLPPNVTETDSDSDLSRTESAARAEAVRAALLQSDEGAFVNSVLRLRRQEPLETPLLEETMQGLQNLGSSPALVPVRGRHIVTACSHLLSFEQNHHDLERINQIRGLVETTITKSVSNHGPATELQGPAARFYSSLLQESSNFVGSESDKKNTTITSGVAEMSRLSAAQHLPLILAVGRECGFLDQLVLRYRSQTRVNVSTGTPMVAKTDDYRIAINCFSGQVDRLLPEPVSAELCPEAEQKSRIFATPQVLVSVEQDDLTNETPQTEMLSGPTMQTRVMLLKRVNDSTIVEEDNRSTSACYKTRLSVYASKDLAEDLVQFAARGIDISCEPDTLPVSSLDIQGNSTDPKSEARRFTVGSDGRVSTFVEAALPVSARMTVNGTRLRQCIGVTRLEGNDSSARLAIVFSVVGAVAFLLLSAIVLFLCMRFRRRPRFSVPDSLAPWDSLDMSQSRTRSTLSSYYYQSGELHQARNRWEGEYRPVQPRVSGSSQKERGAEADETGEIEVRKEEEWTRVGRASGSVLEEWQPFNDSRVSSVTDSYTTCSGDLSSFEVTNRTRLQAGKNSLPGFYVPMGDLPIELHE